MWRKRVEPRSGSKRFLDTFPSLGPLGRSGNVYDIIIFESWKKDDVLLADFLFVPSSI